MQPIRVLLYSDWSFITANPDSPWSVSKLLSFTSLKLKPFAKVLFTVLQRHSPTGMNRLDATLLKDFEELWLFGFIDNTDAPFGLDETELSDVGRWMDCGGGVLITGDHSITRSKQECAANHSLFLAHGRALGSRIKRAGQMRAWEGPPTACDNTDLQFRDNFNTQEGDDPNTLDELAFQSDSRPQTLLDGPVAHPLFFWHFNEDRRVSITKFPDHAHEGKLTMPRMDNDEWPANSPLPVVVAWGRDKRFPAKPRFYELVSVYDGFSAGVGRIVADTSFHHYLDMNLVGLNSINCCGEPVPGTDLDQIAQYYANLVLWLLPKAVLRGIQLDLFLRLSAHPDVLEVWGTGTRQLAGVAHHVLRTEVGISNLNRLFADSSSEEEMRVNQFFSWVFLRRDARKFSPVEPDVALGLTIRAFHRFLDEKNTYDPAMLTELPKPEYLIESGLQLAQTEGVVGIDKVLAELHSILS